MKPEAQWFQHEEPHALILDANIPKKLMRKPEPGPLARAVRHYAPQPPVRRPIHPFDWEPRFTWRAVLPLLGAVSWMVGLTLYLTHLEKTELARISQLCAVPVLPAPPPVPGSKEAVKDALRSVRNTLRDATPVIPSGL